MIFPIPIVFSPDSCSPLPKTSSNGDNFVFNFLWKGDPRVMANVNTKRGVIGILTGGGDVPGLNPAIRGVTLRAIREGYQVIGIRHGWAGLVDMVREKDYDNSDNSFLLDEETVDRAGRTGGTFLPSSPTNPRRVAKSSVPPHLKDKFTPEKNDLTPEVLKNFDLLRIDTPIPLSGRNPPRYRAPLPQAPCNTL